MRFIPLGLIALFSSAFLHGYGSQLNSDTLYLPTLFHFGSLDFRLPPSSYFFPDGVYYFISGLFSGDVISRFYISALIGLFVQFIIVTRFYGFFVWLVIFITNAYFGTSLGVTGHVSLVLLVVLYCLAPAGKARFFAIVLCGVSDPLVLIPITIKETIDRVLIPQQGTVNYGALVLAFAMSFFLSESTKQLTEAGLILCVILIGAEAARYLSFRAHKMVCSMSDRLASHCIDAAYVYSALVLVAALFVAWMTHQPNRYLVPIFASIVIFLAEAIGRNGMKTTLSMALSVIFIIPISIFDLPHWISVQTNSEAQTRCAGRELTARHITNVGTDYWTAKPLQLLSNANVHVAQINMHYGNPYVWISPYNFARTPFRYVLYNESECRGFTATPAQRTNYRYCSRQWLSTVAESNPTPICKDFQLYTLKRTQIMQYDKNKWESFLFNFEYNIKKAERKFKHVLKRI